MMARGVGLVWVVLVLVSVIVGTYADSSFPAMFVFGDSLSDPGNNNNRLTFAKADFLPYGIDFPAGPTGRVCNGQTAVDYIAISLGLPLIPPFNNETTKGEKILKGVNYASSSAGILNDTGFFFGQIIPMDEQIKNFQQTVVQLAVELPKINVNNTQEFLANSLFIVNIGSNDLVGYWIPGKIPFYTVDQYIDLLISKFTKQLKDVYTLGGRRFLVVGIQPLGCLPSVRAALSLNQSECFKPLNAMVVKYNEKLKPLLIQLQADLPGSKFVYGEQYYVIFNIFNNPAQYGFKYTTKSCCGIGATETTRSLESFCLPLLPLECRNRSEYMFFDGAHPTSSLNMYTSQTQIPLAMSLLG